MNCLTNSVLRPNNPKSLFSAFNLHQTLSKSIFIRHFSHPKRSRNFVKKQRQSTTVDLNAGIRHQLKTLDSEDHHFAKEFEQFEDYSELDIFKTDQLYDKHVVDKEIKQEQLRQQIVGRKYFAREKQPSVLTWAEKEHLRHLHTLDKELHNPEALAESFNVPVEAVRKIVKSKWLPQNERRIQKHDKAVAKNRKELGLPAPSVSLPYPENEDVRTLVPRASPVHRKEVPQQSDGSTGLPSRNLGGHDRQNDTMLEGPIRNRKLVSFSEFKRSSGLEKKEAAKSESRGSGFQVPRTHVSRLEDLEILKYLDNENSNRKWSNSNEKVAINIDNPKDSDDVAAYFYDSRQGYQHPYGKLEKTETKISLPGKKKSSKGLYRKGDSFYDSNGEFIYRVPDLFSKS